MGEEGVVINGGSLTAIGTSAGLGRGVGIISSDGTVALNGGTVTAEGKSEKGYSVLAQKGITRGSKMICDLWQIETNGIGQYYVTANPLYITDETKPTPESTPEPVIEPTEDQTVVVNPVKGAAGETVVNTVVETASAASNGQQGTTAGATLTGSAQTNPATGSSADNTALFLSLLCVCGAVAAGFMLKRRHD